MRLLVDILRVVTKQLVTEHIFYHQKRTKHKNIFLSIRIDNLNFFILINNKKKYNVG